MSLPLHLLRLFVTVVDRDGFSRAAEALHISQPAVSKGVRELEAQIGAPLIDRGPGGVHLTEAGVALVAHARELFAVERAAEEELRAIRGLDRGTLRVGASTTIATYHLPISLAEFSSRHPHINLRLISANTHAVIELLVLRQIDVALIEGPVDDPRIEVAAWREEEMCLIAAPDHPLARLGRCADAADLAAEMFVVREPGSGTREVAEGLLTEIGVRPARVLEVGGTEAIKQVVAAGLGVAIVSRIAAADQLALGRLRVIAVEGGRFRRALSRLRLRGRRSSAAGAAFDRILDDRAIG